MSYLSNSRTVLVASALLVASTFGTFAKSSAMDVANAATAQVPGHVMAMSMVNDNGKEFYDVVIRDAEGVEHTLRLDDKNVIVSNVQRSDMMNDYVQGNNK